MLYICYVFASNDFHFSNISFFTGQETSPAHAKSEEDAEEGKNKDQKNDKEKKGKKRSASNSTSKEENERKDMRPDSKIKLLLPPD